MTDEVKTINSPARPRSDRRLRTGSNRNFNTIRVRLLISFVLAVLLAAVAISSVTVVLGTRDGRQREIEQLQSVITLKQAEIKSWVGWLNVNLNIVISDEGSLNDILVLNRSAAEPENYAAAYGALQTRFKWTIESMKLFDELFLMDTSGNVLISTSSGHEKEKHSIYDYYTEGLKGPYIQQPSYSLSLGKMTVVTSSPVFFNGELLGVLAGRASLESLNEIMLERTGLGETGETYLVGSNHRLLTGLRDSGYVIPETYIRTQGAETAINNKSSGSATYTNYSGTRVIGVYSWLPDLQVALMAEQEESEALRSTSVLLMIISGVALAVVIIAVLASMLITRSIVRPLSDLAASATLIAEGNLDHVARVSRDDEVGTVARAFNSMTARLRSLVRKLERRTDQLHAINETGRQISSILNLDDLLVYVAASLQKTFAYHNVGIILVDQASGSLVLKSSAGAYEGGTDVTMGMINPDSIVSSAAKTGNILLVNDVPGDPRYGISERGKHTLSELAVPIKLGDRVVGVLDIEEDRSQAFDDLDLFTAQTLADQLAVAIENANLYRQAQELATLEERSRLARDLHDAVSQTLFSASLIAEVLPRLWERNQDEGRKRLEEIRQLTRGALAEMRTLLLELRPAALTDAELGDLIRQLADSITGRARIPVSVEVEGHCSLSPELKVALYRIAQEALNNVAKHSGASQAAVYLLCLPDTIKLIIKDDGKGFDMDKKSAGSLGMGIMQERAKSIGASVSVESQPGRGAVVTVICENKQGEE